MSLKIIKLSLFIRVIMAMEGGQNSKRRIIRNAHLQNRDETDR